MSKLANLQDSRKILYQLHGDEPTEKFVIWVKDVNNKVRTTKPDWELIYGSLIDLSNKAAIMLVPVMIVPDWIAKYSPNP